MSRERAHQERRHRDDPERTEPIRDFWNVFRRSAPWWNPLGAEPEEAGRRGESARDGGGRDGGAREEDDTLLGGVRAGYRVLDEQWRRGQRLAGEQAARLRDAGPEDWREMTEQMMRSYSDAVIDMSLQWLDFATRFYRIEDLREWGKNFGFGAADAPGSRVEDEGDDEGPLEGAPVAGSRSSAAAIPVEVMAARPTRVKLDVRGAVGAAGSLDVQPLRSREAEKPPLMDLGFISGDDGQPVLRIRVGEEQPSGSYHGVVLDRQSGELRGTLSIEIRGD